MGVQAATLVAASLGLLPLDRLADSLPRVAAGAVYDGSLVCLYTSGSVAVWDPKSGKYMKDASEWYARDKLASLASDRNKLWAADDRAVYLWSAKDRKWYRVGAFDAAGESLVAIAPVGGTPYLVFPSKVIDPTREKGGVFQLPADADRFRKPPLRILAAHGTDSMVWLGTGNGEWGGTLIGLDPATGNWVTSRDGLGYVTGITHAAKGEVVVSWSMSHFGAHTEIKVHKADGSVKTEYPSLRDKYYQCLAYSPHDEFLYGVERGDVVTVTDGKPTKVASLSGPLYEREPNAIGVAPGVSRLIPTGRRP